MFITSAMLFSYFAVMFILPSQCANTFLKSLIYVFTKIKHCYIMNTSVESVKVLDVIHLLHLITFLSQQITFIAHLIFFDLRAIQKNEKLISLRIFLDTVYKYSNCVSGDLSHMHYIIHNVYNEIVVSSLFFYFFFSISACDIVFVVFF